MTYSEKLRLPQWQKKRLQILERDKWTCQSCACTDRNLQVHHIVYGKKKDPWDYADECYQTLCDDCHERRQEIADRAANALKMALRNVRLQEMEEVAQRIINQSFGDAYHIHMASQLQLAYERSTKGDGPIRSGLFSDAVAALIDCQVYEAKSPLDSSLSRLLSLLKQVISELEDAK